MILPVMSVWLFIPFPSKSDTIDNNACMIKEFQDVAQKDYLGSSSNQETGAGWKGKLDYYFEGNKTVKINVRSDGIHLLVQRDCVNKITLFVNEKAKKTLRSSISSQI